jgi:transcriptional regulator with XRE-family HTH domain
MSVAAVKYWRYSPIDQTEMPRWTRSQRARRADVTALPEYLRQTRKQAGLSREELGSRIESKFGKPISNTTIIGWESGRLAPSDEMLVQLAMVLKVSLDVLCLHARRLPPDLDTRGLSDKQVLSAVAAMRKRLKRR